MTAPLNPYFNKCQAPEPSPAPMSFTPVFNGVVYTKMAAPPIVVEAIMASPPKTTINTFAASLIKRFNYDFTPPTIPAPRLASMVGQQEGR